MTFYTIQILRSSFLNKYNTWGYKNVLESVVDITDFEHKSTRCFPNFVKNLVELLPGLKKHKCDKNYEGRFLERLNKGTWMAHVLEHVVIDMHNLLGIETKFGQTRETDTKGVYFIVFETPHEVIGRECLLQGINLIYALFNELSFDLDSCLNRLKNCVQQYEIGPSTSVFINEAQEQKVPLLQLNPPYNLFQFNYGKFSKSIWTSLTDKTNVIALDISKDKQLTKKLLGRFGIPVSEGSICSTIDEASLFFETCKNIVIKPLNSNRSHGVTLNIQNQDMMLKAFQFAKEYSDDILVERFYEGNSFCINVVGKQVIGILKANVTSIIGDGKSTILELIQILNQDPQRGQGDKYILPYIDEDDKDLELLLSQQNLNLFSVLKPKQQIIIQKNIFNETIAIESFHPNILNQAILAAKIIGLDIAGIDLIIKDPRQELSQENGVILEINAGPGFFQKLQHPLKGPSTTNIGETLLKHLEVSKLNNDFMIGHIIGAEFDNYLFNILKKTLNQHKQCGFVTPDAIELPDTIIKNPKLSFSEKYQYALENKKLDAVVLHVNDFQLINEGLISKNQFVIFLDAYFSTFKYHKFIQSPAFFKKIFRTPLDIITPQGVAILNGDDPLIRDLSSFSDGSVIFLSQLNSISHLVPYLKPNSKILHFYNQKIDLVSNGERSSLMDNILIDSKNILRYMANLGLCLHYNWSYELNTNNFKSS